jgi:hypothetical protein
VKGLREKFAEKRRSGFGSAGGDKQGYRRKEIRESGDDSTSCLLVWKEERRRLEEGKPLLILVPEQVSKMFLSEEPDGNEASKQADNGIIPTPFNCPYSGY